MEKNSKINEKRENLKGRAVEYTLSAKISDFERKQVTSSDDAYRYIREFYTDDIHIFESVFILILNRSNHTIGFAKISQGGISGTVVDVRLICKYAIDTLASGIILAHNHPSGNLMPSPQDGLLTRKLREALQWIDIQLLDSLIICDKEYYSMADEGEI